MSTVVLARADGVAHLPQHGQDVGQLLIHTGLPVFTEAERATLELAEQGTQGRGGDAAGRLTDDAWANVAKHFDEEQLIALISLIAVINGSPVA
ncbi:hypothetical protein [Amycolatopsis carbonis]|uniref:hypothetical protein n=1 Tax=Amycolatopsis carbonis TaxID=715471 RepID=UPI003DA72BB0